MERIYEALHKQSTRAYLYRIMLAVAALAAGYGLVSGELVALWVAVGAAILGNGTAARHSSTGRHARE